MHQSKTHRPTFAEINLNYLRHNYRVLRAMVKSDFFCPMIKANAYGHGDVKVAKALLAEGVDRLGIAYIEEGIGLRQAGIEGVELLVFSPFKDAEAQVIVNHKLTPVISSWSNLHAMHSVLPEGAKYPVHLKFNTGMNRLGFAVSDADKLQSWFAKQNHLTVTGVCSHLLHSEDLGCEEGHSQKQLECFERVLQAFSGEKLAIHLFNTTGIVNHSLHNLSLDYGARPGIGLYGFCPSPEGLNAEQQQGLAQLQLKPVMRLLTEVALQQTVKKGEVASYGPSWKAERDSQIAVLPIGYGDGYCRILSNKAEVLLRGQRVPVVGTVCMDFIMVDLTDVIEDNEDLEGEPAVLFDSGSQADLRVDELAEKAGSISYELLTNIGQRVSRVYVD